MNTLAELQQALSGAILTGGAEAADLLHAESREDAERRLAVYIEGYRLRLLEVVTADYPGLQALMGERAFECMVREYIEHHPSPHRNVRWYGDALAVFLGEHPSWSREPALAQMAALEWDLTLVFDAPDQVPMQLAQIADLAVSQWPGLSLRLLRSLRHRELHWNLPAIRQAVDSGVSPPALRAHSAEPWLFWRCRFGVRYRRLDADEAGLLSELQRGLSFSELCECLRQWHADEELALRAAVLLRRWIEDEWLEAAAAPICA